MLLVQDAETAKEFLDEVAKNLAMGVQLAEGKLVMGLLLHLHARCSAAKRRVRLACDPYIRMGETRVAVYIYLDTNGH